MIFVVDNGEHYSDHHILFVETHPEFREWFNEQFLPWAKKGEFQRNYHLIFVGEVESWFMPNKRMTAVDFYDHISKCNFCQDESGELVEQELPPMIPDSCIGWWSIER